jgi:hypothetical protein
MIGSVARALGNFRGAKIGVLVASVRTAAFVLLALGSLVGFGVDRASAQTSYYFDFSNEASGANAFSFMATIVDMTGSCSPSCTLNGTTVSLTGIQTVGANLSGEFPGCSTGCAMVFSTSNNFSTADNVFSAITGIDIDGIDYSAGGKVYNIEAVAGSNAGTEPVLVLTETNNQGGTLTYGLDLTPAPLPGAGPLSYLLLGFAGLVWLWRKTRAATGRVSDAVRARLAPKHTVANA